MDRIEKKLSLVNHGDIALLIIGSARAALLRAFGFSSLSAINLHHVPNKLNIYTFSHLFRSVNKNHTYLLTPWGRVLLEKLIGLKPVKKFPVFYGTRRFITAFTSIRHLSLS
jgi:hypothetical protein